MVSSSNLSSGRLGQEDHKFRASPGYIARYLKATMKPYTNNTFLFVFIYLLMKIMLQCRSLLSVTVAVSEAGSQMVSLALLCCHFSSC